MSCRERERAGQRIDGLNHVKLDSTTARGQLHRLVRPLFDSFNVDSNCDRGSRHRMCVMRV